MERKIYKIPTNYKDSGYIFNGQISKRNALDAAVLGFIGYLIAELLPLNGEMAISGYIFFIGIFALVGIMGFQQIPISVYLSDLIHWRKRKKKPYFYNDNGGAYSVSAADMLINEPQFRDILADAIDSVRNSMAAKRPAFIEGKTFEFESDPELEALQAAQERLMEEQNTIDKKEKTAGPEPHADTPGSEIFTSESIRVNLPDLQTDTAQVKTASTQTSSEQYTKNEQAPDLSAKKQMPFGKAPVAVGGVNIQSLLNQIRLSDIDEGVIDDG